MSPEDIPVQLLWNIWYHSCGIPILVGLGLLFISGIIIAGVGMHRATYEGDTV